MKSSKIEDLKLLRLFVLFVKDGEGSSEDEEEDEGEGDCSSKENFVDETLLESCGSSVCGESAKVNKFCIFRRMWWGWGEYGFRRNFGVKLKKCKVQVL